MNYTRVFLAAIAATVADFAYGFVVYGNVLTSSFAAQTLIYRPAQDQMAYMPIGAAGIFAAMIAASAIYAKGRTGRVIDGAAFGILLGLFMIGACVAVNYATINMSGDHGVKMAAAALVEWVIVGVVISLVYRP